MGTNQTKNSTLLPLCLNYSPKPCQFKALTARNVHPFKSTSLTGKILRSAQVILLNGPTDTLVENASKTRANAPEPRRFFFSPPLSFFLFLLVFSPSLPFSFFPPLPYVCPPLFNKSHLRHGPALRTPKFERLPSPSKYGLNRHPNQRPSLLNIRTTAGFPRFYRASHRFEKNSALPTLYPSCALSTGRNFPSQYELLTPDRASEIVLSSARRSDLYINITSMPAPPRYPSHYRLSLQPCDKNLRRQPTHAIATFFFCNLKLPSLGLREIFPRPTSSHRGKESHCAAARRQHLQVHTAVQLVPPASSSALTRAPNTLGVFHLIWYFRLSARLTSLTFPSTPYSLPLGTAVLSIRFRCADTFDIPTIHQMILLSPDCSLINNYECIRAQTATRSPPSS